MSQRLDRHPRIEWARGHPLHDIVAIGVVAALVLVLFWKFVLLGQIPTNADWLPHYSPWKPVDHPPPLPHNPEIGDSIGQFYPVRAYTAESLKNRSIPLWNPYIFAGNPYLANGWSAVFDPFGLVFLLFPAPVAFGVLMMLQLFTAGLLMYLFLKALDVAWPAALLGAVAFAFNGFFLTWLESTVFVASALWTPLIFLLLHRHFQTGRLSYALWCAFPIAFLCFGGMAQLAVYILPAACLYSLMGVATGSFRSRQPPTLPRALALLGLVCVLGICVAAVQLLPMAEALALSERRLRPGVPRYLSSNVLEPRELLNLVFPTLWGHPADYNYLGSQSQRTAYVGILPLVFAGIAVLCDRGRGARFFKWMAGGVLGFLFALNVHPFHQLIARSLPWFDRLDHTRLLFLIAFALAALAAYGLATVLTAREPSKLVRVSRRLGLVAAMGIVLLLAVSLLATFAKRRMAALAMAYLGARFDKAPAYYTQRLDLLLNLFTPVHLEVFMGLLTAGAGLALVWLFAVHRLPRWLFVSLTIGLTAVDLLYFGLKYTTFSKPELIFPPTEATTFLQKDPDLFRVATIGEGLSDTAYLLFRDPTGRPVFPYPSLMGPMPSETNMPYRLQVVGGHDSIHLASYQEYLQLSQPRLGQSQITLTRYDSTLLDLLNMKYVLTDREIRSPKFELVFDRGTKIYRNREVLPRAFIIPNAKVLWREELVQAELQSLSFDPRKTVLLQDGPVGVPTGGGSGEARVLTYRAEEVLIHATVSGGGGWLVLSDAFYPGWQATVDGKPVKIYRADYAFRAVSLSEGTHLVRFVYYPLTYRVGRSISLSTLLVIGLWLGHNTWSRRRRHFLAKG